MAGEKRSSVRRDARYGVWIAYGDDRTLVPCTLLDVSQSGAQLMLPGNEDVPDDFVLLLSEHGRARRASPGDERTRSGSNLLSSRIGGRQHLALETLLV